MADVKLPPNQFNNVIRYVKRAELDRVKSLRTATFNTLKRLGVARDPSKAVRGVPKGSDQGDMMSIFVWMDKTTPANRPAVRQVVAIDATATARVNG